MPATYLLSCSRGLPVARERRGLLRLHISGISIAVHNYHPPSRLSLSLSLSLYPSWINTRGLRRMGGRESCHSIRRRCFTSRSKRTLPIARQASYRFCVLYVRRRLLLCPLFFFRRGSIHFPKYLAPRARSLVREKTWLDIKAPSSRDAEDAAS